MKITTDTYRTLTTTTYRLGNHFLEVHAKKGRTIGWNISTISSDTQVIHLHADNHFPDITTTVYSASGSNVTPDSLIRDALEAKTAESLFTAVIEAL